MTRFIQGEEPAYLSTRQIAAGFPPEVMTYSDFRAELKIFSEKPKKVE